MFVWLLESSNWNIRLEPQKLVRETIWKRFYIISKLVHQIGQQVKVLTLP